METLFEGIIGQHIDKHGKCRVLIYNECISLGIHPLPPFNISQVKLQEIPYGTLKTALKFVRSKFLSITLQRGDEQNGTTGLWVKYKDVPLLSGYIPLIPEKGKYAKDVEFSDMYMPGLVPDYHSESSLDLYKHNERVAMFLKYYSLFEWANNKDTFGLDSYKISKTHRYDISGLGCDIYKKGNTVMYFKGKLIVPDEETRDKLIQYVNVSSYNDPGLYLKYEGTTAKIDGSSFFKSSEYFTDHPDQLIFGSKRFLIDWIEKQSIDDNILSTKLNPSTTDPYYYYHETAKDFRISIIHNTESGTRKSAIEQAQFWGSKCDTTETATKPISINTRTTQAELGHTNIMKYDNGQYAAMVPFT